MTNSLACIVLAAGNSSRFGSDKRLARNNQGKTLLALTLQSIPSDFRQRMLVLHPGDEAIASAHAADWQIVYAAFSQQGMGNSLAAAIPLIADCSAVLVALADMPLILPSTFASLIAAARPDRIVVPFFEHQRGNPVVIGSDFFSKLKELQGDSGARQLMQQHAGLMVRLEVDDPGVLRDVDTAAELQLIPGFGNAQ